LVTIIIYTFHLEIAEQIHCQYCTMPLSKMISRPIVTPALISHVFLLLALKIYIPRV